MKKLFKENLELMLGLVASIAVILLAISWLIKDLGVAEPIITIFDTGISFAVLIVAYKAIRDKYRKKDFQSYLNEHIANIWKFYGRLVREKGGHDGIIELQDGEDNVLQIAVDTNEILSVSETEKASEYIDFISFPDELTTRSTIETYVHYKKFEARAMRENASTEMVARLVAAQIAYRINENFTLFSANATSYDDEKALVVIKINDDLDTEDEAKQFVDLINYIVIYYLALD